MYRTISLDRFEGSLTRHEHAVFVMKLLEIQEFPNPPWLANPDDDDAKISPTVQEYLLKKLQEVVKEAESKKANDLSILSCLICPGCLVTTRKSKIAPLGPVKVSRHVRDKTYGIVISESEYFPGYWLVDFYRLRRFDYVATHFLKFISSSSHVTRRHNSADSPSGTPMTIKEIQTKANDKDLIMLCILNSKIHRSKGYKDMSVTGIANLFSRYFPFMTANRIQRFVNKYRAKIDAMKAKELKSSENNASKSKQSPDSVIDGTRVVQKENANQSSKSYQ